VYIATVIPIARGIPFDALTYYASEPYQPGTLVAIPFGRQTIYGFVTETIPLTEAKTFVKQASFSIKKIKQHLGHVPYFEGVTRALRETGAAAIAPVGAVTATVIPQVLFEYISGEKLPNLLSRPLAVETNIVEETVALGTRSDRTDIYKRMIRSSFAAKQSVLFIAPTIRALEWWKSQLEKGIARHVMVFHSKVNKKTLRSQFVALKQHELPFVVFATPAFSVLPVDTLGAIVVEDESSSLYKSSDRYEIDARIFLRQLAASIGTTILWGDTLPRFETLKRTQSDHLPRTFIPDKLHIVPIEPYRTILPSETIEIIRHAEKKKRKLFIYTNRKGVAPLSRCADCGTVVQCPECELPMALRNRISSGVSERFFVCLHCSSTLDADYKCSYCAGWNIVPVAIGTESIRDAVAQIVGAEAIITIDDDITPDSKVIEEMLQHIEKQKFAIVIGTQKALPYIKKIDYAVVPFFDRLLSTPSLYTTEHILRLVMECNEAVSSGVILCTKTPEFPLIKQLEMKKLSAIIYDELELRKQLGYPPYGTLLKISMTVPQGYRQEVAGSIEEYFRDLDIAALPARRISAGSMKVLLSWLIKVTNDYIEEEGEPLTTFLDTLRFPYKIEQNPERL